MLYNQRMFSCYDHLMFNELWRLRYHVIIYIWITASGVSCMNMNIKLLPILYRLYAHTNNYNRYFMIKFKVQWLSCTQFDNTVECVCDQKKKYLKNKYILVHRKKWPLRILIIILLALFKNIDNIKKWCIKILYNKDKHYFLKDI